MRTFNISMPLELSVFDDGYWSCQSLTTVTDWGCQSLTTVTGLSRWLAAIL